MSDRWKSFLAFYGLTFLLLALVPLLSALLGTSMDFAEIAGRASQKTGVEWTSNLWDVIRLSWAEPGLALVLLGSAVPTLAALAMIAAGRGGPKLHELLRSLHPFGRTGFSAAALGNYALLVGAIVLCLMAAFFIRDAIAPGQYERNLDFLSFGLFASLLSAAFLDQGAVLEEAGWRGYATPLLQGHVLSPVWAAVLVGVAWALWHVPRDVVSNLPAQLGIAKYLFLFLPAFSPGTIAVSIIASYFMNRAGGSLVPAIMVHGLTNDAVGISGFATIERALTPGHQITQAIPMAALALCVVWFSGRQLGAAPSVD